MRDMVAWAWSPRRDRLAVVDHGGKRVRELPLEREGRPTRARNLPKGMRAEHVAWAGREIFLTAGARREAPSLLHWREDGVEALSTGLAARKHYDALFVRGERLIAVDDVVTPKYLVVVDVGNPACPGEPQLRLLENHGTWGTIHAAAMNERWLALLSTTNGRGGRGVHLAWLDLATLTERYHAEDFEPRGEVRWIIEEAVPARSNRWHAERLLDKLEHERVLAEPAPLSFHDLALGPSLRRMQALAFCGDVLVAPSRGSTMWLVDSSALDPTAPPIADASQQSPFDTMVNLERLPQRRVQLEGLVRCHRLVADAVPDHMIAIGRSPEGHRSWERVFCGGQS